MLWFLDVALSLLKDAGEADDAHGQLMVLVVAGRPAHILLGKFSIASSTSFFVS